MCRSDSAGWDSDPACAPEWALSAGERSPIKAGARFTLRDFDNRNEDGAAFEFIGDLAQVIEYLDGALRKDLTEPESDGADIDEAIDKLADHDLGSANVILRRLAVHVSIADHEDGSRDE